MIIFVKTYTQLQVNIASLSIESDPQKRILPLKNSSGRPKTAKAPLYLTRARAQRKFDFAYLLDARYRYARRTHIRTSFHTADGMRTEIFSLSLPFICRPLMFLFFCNLFSLSLSPCIVFLFPSKFSLMSLSLSYVFPFIFYLLSLSLSLSLSLL